ncbi:hypothetical protein BGX34_006019, partial [Mortierella sp. NVP85]
MEELSVLTRKAVHIIASGQLYADGSPLNKRFDIRELLPNGFHRRDQTVRPILNVAPLPSTLQEKLTAIADRKAGKDDISDLLSAPHLKSLHTHFLSSSDRHMKRDAHPTWTRLANLMQSSSETSFDNAQSSTTADAKPTPTKSPNGLSGTIQVHIQEFAVSVDNLWCGSIYDKLLDYLLRILLRLHLAPNRERNTHESRSKAKQEPQDTTAQKRPDEEPQESTKQEGRKAMRESKKLQKWKILKLSNELEKWLRKPLDVQQPRVKKILDRLHKLGPITSKAIASDKATASPLKPHVGRVDEGGDATGTNEPSRKKLKSMQGLLKVLLESPSLQNNSISWKYVQQSAFVGSDFTQAQCEVIARIVNILRPYVPKRQVNEGPGRKTKAPMAHVALRAPLVMIANAVLRSTGYTKFTRSISPEVSPSSTHALHLDATAIFEILCPPGINHFDVLDTDRKPLTQARLARDHKKAVFGAFFNVGKAQQLCLDRKMIFANRITFVDRFTLRIMGEVIPNGPDRTTGPVYSEYEAAKREKRGGAGTVNWSQEAQLRGMSKHEISKTLDHINNHIAEVEDIAKPIREELTKKEQVQAAAADKHRTVSIEGMTAEQGTKKRKEAYRELKAARADVRECRLIVEPLNRDAHRLRRERYYWNN